MNRKLKIKNLKNKMKKKETEKQVEMKQEKPSKNSECSDKLCPIHGSKKLKLRGRIFEGNVIRKLPGRIVIQFERMIHIRKYERYEKRRTKLHARLPDCMKNDINVGDYIQIAETRPISKIIHCVVVKKIRSSNSGDKK